MATEILYCARCRRVLLPREVAAGAHHFVDGQAICARCFTRMSRRLRPPTGATPTSDLVRLESSPGEGAAAKAGAPEPPGPPPRARPGRLARALIWTAFFLLGGLLGAAAFLLYLPR